MPSVLHVKVVIRCMDFDASLTFYRDVLRFSVTEDWDENDGRGAILAPGGDESLGSVEIYQMSRSADRYHAAFSLPLANDKVDIQLRTRDIEAWVEALRDIWPFTEPESTPWGHRWIKLRDPDNLLVAIYEET